MISGLISGHTYTIMLFAVTMGDIPSKTPAQLDATVVPLAVTGLKSETVVDTTHVKVSWTDADNSHQDSYQLSYKDETKATDWTNTPTLTDREKTVSNLFPGDKYTFKVEAVSNNQISSAQTATSVLQAAIIKIQEVWVVVETDPLPPTGLTVSATTTSSVKISWQYDISNSFCEKWKVKYTKTGTNIVNETTVNGANVHEVTISNLGPGLTYAVSVFALTTDGVVSQTAAQLEATLNPLPVTTLKADTVDTTSVKLTWEEDSGSYQDSYRLRYHGKHQATVWTAWQPLDDKMKTVNGLFPGDKYTFEVKAVSKNQSSNAETATATVFPLPPTQLTVNRDETTTNSVNVKWIYEHNLSHSEQWRVTYTVKGTNKVLKTTNTDSANVLKQTIGNLRAGLNYTITVYGVTYDDTVSKTTAQVDATVTLLAHHQDSLATEDKQHEVVITVSVPSSKHRCDGHAMVPLRPHPLLGRGSAMVIATNPELASPAPSTPSCSRSACD
ncbi:hypothetical protein LSAT2_019802 [Lamellibrachia satsuma]|nr:hypothetical protein LSAT2_019802 [Lamellibrachia satsuma]